MSPLPRRTPDQTADALIGVTPLISRWIERLLANHEPRLTLAQFLTLRAVADGVESSGELARRAGVSGPAVSQLVSGLTRAGLLHRADVSADRRRATLTLSVAGEQALTSANRLLRQSLSSALSELPPGELNALAQALPYVEAVLAGVTPPRRPAPPRPPHRPASAKPPRPLT